mgnify:CR=1 FL=1
MIKYIVFFSMLIISCKTTKQEKPIKCCDKETPHALWNCGNDIEYKYSELIKK